MSSSGFSLSLDIDRRACRRVPALVFCCTLLALTGISLSGLPWPMRTAATILILACGLWEFRRAWPGSAGHVNRIHISGEGRFLVGCAAEPDTFARATVIHWWVVPGFAVGLAFIDQTGQRHQAILFRDLLAPAVWRRLHVRLRYGADTVKATGSL